MQLTSSEFSGLTKRTIYPPSVMDDSQELLPVRGAPWPGLGPVTTANPRQPGPGHGTDRRSKAAMCGFILGFKSRQFWSITS